MDYQRIARVCIKDGLQIPNSDNIFIANVLEDKFKEMLDNSRRARIDSYYKTKQVAEGTDPSSIPIKCYAPCHEQVGTDSVFSDFKDEGSIKEYRLSGMCQKCQDYIFG
jgi:hypothetical protein